MSFTETSPSGLVSSINKRLESSVGRIQSCTHILRIVADIMFGPTGAESEAEASVGTTTNALLYSLEVSVRNLESEVERFDG